MPVTDDPGSGTAKATFSQSEPAPCAAYLRERVKLRGVVVDLKRGSVTLKEYAGQWLAHRPGRQAVLVTADPQGRPSRLRAPLSTYCRPWRHGLIVNMCALLH